MIITIVLLLLLSGGLWVRRRKRSRTDRTPVKNFDPLRYMGRWYEIARLDNRFERRLDRIRADYRMLPSEMIEVKNSGYDSRTGRRRERTGKAYVVAAGRLKVSFFSVFYSEYNILALGENYEWALVGGATDDRLWILSRTPSLPSGTFDRILHHARQRGYDTSELVFDTHSGHPSSARQPRGKKAPVAGDESASALRKPEKGAAAPKKKEAPVVAPAAVPTAASPASGKAAAAKSAPGAVLRKSSPAPAGKGAPKGTSADVAGRTAAPARRAFADAAKREKKPSRPREAAMAGAGPERRK